VVSKNISWLKAYGRFGGTYRLHLQGRRLIQAGKQDEAGESQAELCCLHFQDTVLLNSSGCSPLVAIKQKMLFAFQSVIVFTEQCMEAFALPALSRYVGRRHNVALHGIPERELQMNLWDMTLLIGACAQSYSKTSLIQINWVERSFGLSDNPD
jgi:hypothetical protein